MSTTTSTVGASAATATLSTSGTTAANPSDDLGEHDFLLRPTASGGTLFSQGEHFSGALLWVFDPRELVPDFEAVNVALAARAERVARAGPAAPP